MLYADKQALETDLKVIPLPQSCDCRRLLTSICAAQVSLLAIRERELNLYSDNFRNIGTQAALLAGFAYSGCTIATDLKDNDYERALYIFVTTGAMSLNVSALFASVTCCMFGPGLALRGPDGSMDQAVEGLALEYRTALMIFLFGLVRARSEAVA